jgi:hypothetical protein
MSSSPQAAVDALFALLQRYVRGEVPLADMVAAYEAMPDGATGDGAWSLDPDDTPAAEERLVALFQALGPPDRAG